MISPIEIGEGREKVEISKIYDTLRLLGISAKYRGYHYLAWAVMLALEDEDRLLAATKRLYPLVAERYNTTWHCVERDIRTVIDVSWASSGRAYLERLAGRELTEKPVTVDYIDIIVGHFLRYPIPS